jgi:AcrR family transcriptional regulator
MSTPYEDGGRSEQKRRTREALVSAARELVARGSSPTVEDAASAAGISRTTAYRYFPNQHALLSAAHPETVASSLLDAAAPMEPVARLDSVIRTFLELITDTESQQRTMLRLSLDADPVARGTLPLRQGRAIGWFTEALEPLRDQLSAPVLHQLVLAIRSAVGIEALVWLTDVGGLAQSDAVELMRWSAQSLLAAAMQSPPPLAGELH